MSSKIAIGKVQPSGVNGDENKDSAPKSSSSKKRSSTRRQSNEKEANGHRRSQHHRSSTSRRHRSKDRDGSSNHLDESKRSEDGGSDDRLDRSKRREKEDRDAKRRARSNRSSSSKATVPGAQHASAARDVAASKKSRSAKRDHRRSRSRSISEDSDVEDQEDLDPTIMKAVLDRSSRSQSRNNKDEKRKERRSTRATAPGAQSTTATDTRDRRKASRSSSKRPDEAEIPVGQDSMDNGEAVVAATIVEEVDEEAQQKENEARMRQMVEQEAARQRQEVEAENQRLRDEMEQREADRLEKKKKKKQRRNKMICILLILLVLIGGGVGAFFALQGGGGNKGAVVDPTSPEDKGAPSPSEQESASPTLAPTDNPSSAPTEVDLKYEAPNRDECERIANGIPLEDEEDMFERNFDVSMEVDLVDDRSMNSLVPELQTKIEQLLIPDLIGCPRDLFEQQQEQRRLGHLQPTNASTTLSRLVHRFLQSARIRYAIAKAGVTVTVADTACEKSSSPNCSVVMVHLDLTVRGEEKILWLAGVIEEVFPNGVDIQPDLELIAPFGQVVVRIVRSLDQTAAPTTAPTGTPSESPTASPSSSPSASPTRAPVTGPVAPSPTKGPSKAPSKAPTLPPTEAPTPTPPPTFAPQPGLTPPPTPPPTARPTISPSFIPSMAPSSGPSILDSLAPSPAPTNGPTSGPTSNPTSPAPTSTYIGCFQDDSSNRDLELYVKQGDMDVSTCRNFCMGLGFPYAGIQAGSSCFCGTSYGSRGTGNCDSSCSGSDQFCGGLSSNSVYFSGAPLASAPSLDNDLYCGCFRDGSNRVLPHEAPFRELSQKACIHYCKSQNKNYAGLQWNDECYCGDSANDLGLSQTCFFIDRNNDGVRDECALSEPSACENGSSSCFCGGADANAIYRTSSSVSCPAEVAPPTNLLACKIDTADRDLDIMVKKFATPDECMNICKDIGYVYSAMQSGEYCFCGNSYGRHGTASGQCNRQCVADSALSGCGGDWANSIYYTGATFYNYVSELETDLYCGCTRDLNDNRDLDHMAPYLKMSENACIQYCRAKNYQFAGLQFNEECWCGDSPGSHSFSLRCESADVCDVNEESACYGDGVTGCQCGAAHANSLFRTSQSVSCPAVTPESYTYVGCFRDSAIRVLPVWAQGASTVENCVKACRDMGFPYSGLQVGGECRCGNQYDSQGTAQNCDRWCSDGECGGDWANSVYGTGLTTSAAALESDLYCGCTADFNNDRDLPHQAPYLNLSQKACIHYCKAQNYAFAGLQFVDECWCGDAAGGAGPSYGCDTVDRNNDGNRDLCALGGSDACYFQSTSCNCGGTGANTLFRTSTSVTCPGGNLISKDYAVAEWDSASTTNEDHVPGKAIDGNTCGDFFGCQSVAEILGSPTNPYWQVNLGFKAIVKRVVVWNRTDCCSDRMFGLELQLLDSSGNVLQSRGITIGENGSSDPASQSFDFSSGVENVVFVRIQRNGVATLNIAEVQVFS